MGDSLAAALSKMAKGYTDKMGASEPKKSEVAQPVAKPSPTSSSCPHCGAHNLVKNADKGAADAVAEFFKKQ